MAEPTHYDAGDAIDLSGEFRNAAGALADPATITFRLKDPAGNLTTYVYGTDPQPVRVSIGLFMVTLTLTTVGRYTYRFEGTGAVADTEETTFIVDPSEFTATYGTLLSARALCGIADVREFTKLANNLSDYQIARMINAASTTIHRVAGREFKVSAAGGTLVSSPALNPQIRVFDRASIGVSPMGDGYYYLEVGDLAAFTTVTIDGVTVAGADVLALPSVRDEWEPYTDLRFNDDVDPAPTERVTVTGTWGFPSVPYDITQACILTVFSWLHRDVIQFSETFVDNEAVPRMLRELPREAFDTVMGYQRRAYIIPA